MHIIKTHVRAAWHFLLTRYYSTNRLSKIIALSGRFSMDLCKTISEGNPTCKSLFGKPHSFQRLIWSTQLLIATKHMLLRLTWHHRWCKLWLLNGSFQTVFQMHCQTAGRKKKTCRNLGCLDLSVPPLLLCMFMCQSMAPLTWFLGSCALRMLFARHLLGYNAQSITNANDLWLKWRNVGVCWNGMSRYMGKMRRTLRLLDAKCQLDSKCSDYYTLPSKLKPALKIS